VVLASRTYATIPVCSNNGGITMPGSEWQPNPDQQRAIETLNGFCVVMAGPGTGKTDTLAAKTAAILKQGGRPLAVTYTRAAAHELIQRLGPLHERVTACTCHSLAFQLFTRLAPPISARSPRLLDMRKHERESILRQVRRHLARDRHPSLAQSLSLPELGERISRSKTLGPQTESDRELLARYEAVKGSGRIDFQDLLIHTTHLLSEQSPWRDRYRVLYSHILIDEAQDLDPLQARFLTLFVQDALTVFLDPDQAIYAYTGADPAATLQCFARLSPRTAVALRPTYRSRAPIIHAALTLIAHNPNGHHDRDLIPVRTGRLPPRWVRVSTQAAEARLIAHTIMLLQQRQVAPADILCLFRANPYRTMLEIELARSAVPFRLLQGSREQQPTYLEYGVLPLTALLLRVADVHAPWIEEAALRVYVGSQTAAQLAGRAAGMSLTEAARPLGERVHRGVAAFLEDLAVLRLLGRKQSPAVIGDVAARLLTTRSRTPSDNPAELASAVAGLALFPSLDAFATHIETLQQGRSLPPRARVCLATIHKAKGRQSRIVFLLGASEGVFPALHPGTDLAEERRICFVGVTRAQDVLIVSSPRTVAGARTPPSRFIREGRFTRLFFPTPHRLAALLDQV
jgi:DNA helicase-2/ATP-dependent DNA helicase PcrA